MPLVTCLVCRPRRESVFALVIASLSGLSVQAQSPPASNLEGQRLEVDGQTEDVTSHLVAALFGDLDGEVESVVVSEDRYNGLALSVHSDGLDGKWVEVATVTDEDGVEIPLAGADPVEMRNGEPAVLEIALSEGAASDVTYTSLRLTLRVKGRRRGSVGPTTTFSLPKRWCANVGCVAEPPVRLRATRVDPRYDRDIVRHGYVGLSKAADLSAGEPRALHLYYYPRDLYLSVAEDGSVGLARGVAGAATFVTDDLDGPAFSQSYGRRDVSPSLDVHLRSASGTRYLTGGADRPSMTASSEGTLTRWVFERDPATSASEFRVKGRKEYDAGLLYVSARRGSSGGPWLDTPGLLEAAGEGGVADVFPWRVVPSTRTPDWFLGASARGPSLATVDLRGLVEADGGAPLGGLLGIAPLVYVDESELSGVYYYLPAAFTLAWSARAGHGVEQHFRGEREVGVVTRLTAGVTPEQVQVAEDLLRIYTSRHGLPFTALRPVAISTAPGATEVQVADNAVRDLGVASDRLSIVEPGQITDDLRVAWVGDDVEAESFRAQLTARAEGIVGNVRVTPGGGTLGPQIVPARIGLRDPRSYGKIGVEGSRSSHLPLAFRLREDGLAWTNPTPYPIRLLGVHALVADCQTDLCAPSIFSWGLDGEDVAPGQTVVVTNPESLGGRAAPLLTAMGDGRAGPLDPAALYLWADYEVLACASCDRAVVAAGTSALRRRLAQTATLETGGVLEDVGVRRMTVFVRSRYFEPLTTTPEPVALNVPLLIEGDGLVSEVPRPIYLPETGDLEGGAFEYRVVLVMDDGAQLNADVWLPSLGPDLYIGVSQLCLAFGSELGACPQGG